MVSGVGACLLMSGCVSQPERHVDKSLALYEVAVASFQAERYEAALGETQDALKADPQNADAHNLLGLLSLRQGADLVAQLRTHDCLTARDAEMVQLDASRRFKEAQVHFRNAVEARDAFAEAWNNLAVASLNLQEWAEAVEAGSAALAIGTYPQPYVARGNRGWAYYQSGEIQKAWRDLHEAVSRQPGFCVGRYRLAKVFMARQQYDEAAEQLDVVVGDKRCPIQDAFLLGGLVEKKRGNPTRSKELLDRCVPLAPRSCTADQCRRYASALN